MTILELGALGEFVGAFAVVGTLFYLAIQIRTSNRLAVTSAYQSRADSNISIVTAVLQSPGAPETLRKVNENEPLAENEQAFMDNLAINRNHVAT
jgi:hypothetical protein